MTKIANMRAIGLSLFLLVSLTAQAEDAVRWVSPTGNDATGDGLTEQTAWKTPQKAIDYFGTGAGIVRLAAGTFEGANPIINISSGTVKVIGAGRDATIIKPDNTVAQSAVLAVKSGSVISNLTVTGCSGAYAVSLQNGGGIAFCNVVSNTSGGVKFTPNATGSFCRNSSISFNSNASGPAAVHHNSWGAAYLRNCLIIGNTSTSANNGNLRSDNGGVLNVSFCTLLDNEGTATGVAYTDNSSLAFKNCILRGNRGNAAVTPVDAAGKKQNQITFANCLSDRGEGTNPVVGNPCFAGGCGDYRLRLMSACRDAGASTSGEGVTDAADVDFYGQPRVSGSLPDVGCAECQEPASAVCDIDISNEFPHYAENLRFAPYFEQLPAGSAYDCGWTLSAANGTVLTNIAGSTVRTAFDCYGLHTLKLSATNRQDQTDVLTASMELFFDLPLTNCVAATGGDGVWPYVRQETATTNFAAAVAALPRGGVVWLMPGTFTGPQPLFNITNEINILGCGAGITILKPDNTVNDHTVKLAFDRATIGGVTLTGNTKKQAVLINKTASLVDSVVISNTVGGVKIDGTVSSLLAGVSRCEFIDNSNSGNGGGIYATCWGDVCVDNCLFVGNRSSANGGGVYCDNGLNAGRHRFEYCTFVGNQANSGGGIYGSYTAAQVKNCIVKDNECHASKTTPNFGSNQSIASNFVITNTWNVEEFGVNPITGDVAFKNAAAGNYRLRATSVCRDAGVDLTGHDADRLDLDGNQRVWGNAPDVGCYEFIQGAETTCDILGLTTDEIWKGAAVSLTAKVTPRTPGSTFNYYWTLLDETSAVAGTSTAATYNFTVPGYGHYTLQLEVVNRADPNDTAECTLANAFISRPLTNYVVSAATAAYEAQSPYDSWQTAATNLQHAVDNVCVGGTVVMSAESHRLADIQIARDMTVLGTGADRSTRLVFKGGKRIIYLNASHAVMRNLTFTGGWYTGYGNGSCVWIGPNGGTVEDCVFVANKRGGGDASVSMQSSDARLTRCQFMSNYSDNSANKVGILTMSAGLVENCLFVGNTNVPCAVVALTGAKARLVNNTFADNVSTGAVHFAAKPTANAMLNCILCNSRRPDGSTGDEWTTSLTAASDLAAQEAAVSNCCYATGATLGANPVAGDPRFRRLTGKTYWLRSDSPCVNAGMGTDELDAMRDLKGESRVKRGAGTSRRRVDIGCYERNNSGGVCIIIR